MTLVNPAGTETAFFEHIRRADVTGSFRPMGRIQSAATVAAEIVQCIRRPKIEVYPYRISRAVAWVNALAPSILDRFMIPFYRERMNRKTGS